jgi:hypothetical protein
MPVNQTSGLQRAPHSVYDVPTGGRQHASTQFVQPGGPTMGRGTNMLTSPVQQAHLGRPILTWDQISQVNRQVEEDFVRHAQVAQVPGRPEIRQWVYIT